MAAEGAFEVYKACEKIVAGEGTCADAVLIIIADCRALIIT